MAGRIVPARRGPAHRVPARHVPERHVPGLLHVPVHHVLAHHALAHLAAHHLMLTESASAHHVVLAPRALVRSMLPPQVAVPLQCCLCLPPLRTMWLALVSPLTLTTSASQSLELIQKA
mmetsp:Transcript_70226/g.228319  ORF Transcript_70226/g.228319 Transcript_70226/m.228319 type:complete len:119 (-) Transcript_70226:476-832(-)